MEKHVEKLEIIIKAESKITKLELTGFIKNFNTLKREDTKKHIMLLVEHLINIDKLQK
jgi:hypothetical protein